MNRHLRNPLSAFVLSLSVLGAAPAGARPAAPQVRRLPPVDEAKQDASLVQFRARLQEAIARRDLGALQKSIDPDLRFSFGDEGGRQSFLTQLDPAAAGASKLWDELERALSLGGAFMGPSEFCAPYPFARFPQNLDAFAYVVITAAAAPVRAQPAEDAPVVYTLHYDIVRRADKSAAPSVGGTRPQWVRVLTPTGKSGFVRERELRSPSDYRACFHKDGDRWMLTTFVAGD